jgi:Secretion system C-terminal sorting domain
MLQPQSFLLEDGSPCIDAGDTAAACIDIENALNIGHALAPSKGTLRNDIGAFGGALTKVLPSISVYDLRLSKSSVALSCSTGQTVNTAIEILNRSSVAVTMDSITTKNSSVFHASNKLGSRLLTIVKNDSIIISCSPTQSGAFTDTAYIYHNASGVQNPLTIPITLTVTASTGVETGSVTPHEFRLYQNSPNPFNPSTTIRYSLAEKNLVRLTIFDVLGKEITKLVDAIQEAGPHSLQWNASHVASGTYFCRIEAGNFVQTNKMLLLK